MKLKLLALSLSSNERENYGMEIFASGDCVVFS